MISRDLALLRHMEKTGLDLLHSHHPEAMAKNQYRIGFHGPRYNSQHHLHMHLIILPFTGSYIARKVNKKVIYGSHLVPVSEVLRTCLNKDGTAGQL